MQIERAGVPTGVAEDAGRRLGAARPPFAPFTQRVGGLAAIPALLRQFEVEPASVLESVGLARDALDRADDRIAYLDVGRLLAECVARTKCQHFGFLAGRALSLDSLGLIGELARRSATVGESLRTLVLNHQLDSEGALMFLIERGGVADLGYAIYAPGVRVPEQIFDLMIATMLNVMRELCGPAFTPTSVLLPHAPPADDRMLRSFFRGRLQYHDEICALRFPAGLLNQRVPGADPDKLRRAEVVAASSGHGSLVARVYRALRLLLIHGKSCGDDVAAMLSMHRRTLNRRLEDEGTTFRDVLEDVRFDVACQLLSGTALSVDDIAAALAYESVGSFMRSFRRWSAMTPGQWRREHASPWLRLRARSRERESRVS